MDVSLIALILLAVMLAMAEAGYRFGRRQKVPEKFVKNVEVIESALLTLLSLLLAFGISMAESRYFARIQHLMLEANTIGTAFMRTELAPEPTQAKMKEGIRRYVDARVEFYRLPDDETALKALDARTNENEDRIWRLVTDHVRKNPSSSTSILITGAMNEMFDARTDQEVLFQVQVPRIISYLLLLSAALVVGLIGYGYGLGEARHFTFVGILSLVVALTLFVFLDLNRVRQGLIRVSPGPLVSLQERFKSAHSSP